MHAFFEQLNEFRYKAATGKEYIVYFLKFWQDPAKTGDFIIKYQITSQEGDFVWYGRISRMRIQEELQLSSDVYDKYPEGALFERIEQLFKRAFIFVVKKGLDKGYEKPNTEFLFDKGKPISKRSWSD